MPARENRFSRCCLLTTAANRGLESIHDRMPVIILPQDWEEWFSPVELTAQSFLRITIPYPAEEMSALAAKRGCNFERWSMV